MRCSCHHIIFSKQQKFGGNTEHIHLPITVSLCHHSLSGPVTCVYQMKFGVKVFLCDIDCWRDARPFVFFLPIYWCDLSPLNTWDAVDSCSGGLALIHTYAHADVCRYLIFNAVMIDVTLKSSTNINFKLFIWKQSRELK